MEEATPAPEPSDAARAHAELQRILDGSMVGTVDFSQLNTGVRIVAFARGLDDGLFGLHIHEGGSCDQPGLHFNPADTDHGEPGSVDGSRHAGDLGNIRSENGRARYDRIDTVLRMDSTDSIIGRVVSIHIGQDDLNTQPSGEAGDIAVCGVIEAR